MKYRVTVEVRQLSPASFIADGENLRTSVGSATTFFATDGATYEVLTNEIIMIKKEPLSKCPKCGKDIIPDMDVIYSGNKKIGETKTCPECGAEVLK